MLQPKFNPQILLLILMHTGRGKVVVVVKHEPRNLFKKLINKNALKQLLETLVRDLY